MNNYNGWTRESLINKIEELEQKNAELCNIMNNTYTHLLAMRSLEEYRIRKMLEELDDFKEEEDEE